MLSHIPQYLISPTFIALCLMSIYSIAIMVDQAIFMLSNREDVDSLFKFLDDDRKSANDFETFATARKTLHRRLILAGLKHIEKPAETLIVLVGEEAMSLRWEAEKRLAALGTIANIAPFVGLFGTVVGVMQAFHSISMKMGAGPAVVSGGISEALICTAAGLFVAVPAVVAYDFFLKRARRLSMEFERVSALLVYRVRK
jgi:biopolymer transport protein ExbB/TolQ